jgi:glycosyltransferase involved in cell wall biosynthesis
MQAEDASVRVGRHDWCGRSVWVGRTDRGRSILHRARKTLLGVLHDLRWLWRARVDQYDSVLVSDKYLLAAVACVVARARGLKFLFWMTYPYHLAQITLGRERISSNPTFALVRGGVTGFLLHHWIIPRSDYVFVQSQRMAADFAAEGADPARMMPVITGVDLDGVELLERPDRGSTSRTLTIGYLGTLARQRRLEILVDMLDELRRRGVIARLLLIGDGNVPEDRLSIERRARALGLDSQVEITGFLPRREALTLVQTADICVSPFRPSPALEVASPTKLVEYLALGLPVVANAHPDQTQVLRECRAGVCVPWHPRHFARAVHWLSKRSAAELAEMGRRGQAWVAGNRSYAKIAEDFERACLKISMSTGNTEEFR